MTQEYKGRDLDACARCRAELLGPRRGDTLDLDDLLRVGALVFGDPEGLRLYGMSPSEYHARGIRLAGRTAIECCIDPQAMTIARTVQEVVTARFPGRPVGVVDLFAGSANLMVQVARMLDVKWCVGFEADPLVWSLSAANLRALGVRARLELGACQELLASALSPAPGEPIVAILAPPWGPAFDFERGLDLGRTTPPVRATLDLLAARFPDSPIVAVVQTYFKMAMDSYEDVVAGREVYFSGLAGAPGERNHGYLVCAAAMRPAPACDKASPHATDGST